MKAITTTMYVCGSLMIAAAIMGAADYKKARHNGTFDKLYKEEPVAKSAKEAKQIDIEDYSRGAINPAESVVKDSPQKNTTVKTVAKTLKPVIKKKKRLSLKKYSRAALDEDIELPVIVDSTLKIK